jgi:WD40 repeat protein
MTSTLSRMLAALLIALALAPRPAAAQEPHGKADRLPPGAVARLGDLRWRDPFIYGSGIVSLSFAPDGKVLASAAESGLRVWDVATGTALPWSLPAARAQLVRYSPDGTTLLTFEAGCGNGVPQILRRLEVGTGKSLGETKLGVQADGRAARACLSDDGKVILIPAGEGRVALWDVPGNKLLREFQNVSLLGNASALSPDGRTLAVVDRQGWVGVYDAAGKRLHRFEADDECVLPAFSPDGRFLVASAPRSLHVWEVASGKEVRTVKGCRGRVAFFPGGGLMACGDMRAVRLFAVPSFKELRPLEAHNNYYVTELTFSRDGRRLAGALNHGVAIWDIASGRQLNRPAGHQAPVCILAFSRDGQALASGDEHGVVAVWDLARQAVRQRLSGHFTGVRALAFRPDGKALATGDGYAEGSRGPLDAYIRLWDLGTGKRTREWLAHLNAIRGLSFTPDGKRLVSAGGDGRLRSWAAGSGERLWQARVSAGQYVWADLAADGRTVLYASVSGQLGLWRADTGERLRELNAPALPGPRYLHSAFLQDGRVGTVVDGRHTETVQVWDGARGKVLRSATLSPPAGETGSFAHALSPDGKTYATNADKHAVVLYDTFTGKRFARLDGHTGPVASLAFSPDSRLLASGSHDATVLLWDVSGERLRWAWSRLRPALANTGEAARELKASPAEAVRLLRGPLRSALRSEGLVHKLVPRLGDPNFKEREQATAELLRLGSEAELGLRLALTEDLPAEARRRIEAVLGKLGNAERTPDTLDVARVQLAVEVLGEVAGPEAGALLRELAAGPPHSVVARQARGVLQAAQKDGQQGKSPGGPR